MGKARDLEEHEVGSLGVVQEVQIPQPLQLLSQTGQFQARNELLLQQAMDKLSMHTVDSKFRQRT